MLPLSVIEVLADLAAVRDALTVATELRAMAARGDRSSDAYRAKYAAYQQLKEEKRLALGGEPRVDAPERPDQPKKTTKKAAARRDPTAHRVPTTRNRGRVAARYTVRRS